METTLDDKLRTVAVFMGYKFENGLTLAPFGDQMVCVTNVPSYHTSYNRLMKAWQKFRDLELVPGHKVEYYNRRNNLAQAIPFVSIGEAFDALHEAIQWYNSLNK